MSETNSTAVHFDPCGHTYSREGRRLPSVTEVLSGVGMLPDYDEPRYADGFYAARGTAVHKAIALDLMGQLDDDSVDEHVAPYLARFRSLIATIGPVEPLFSEQPLAHPVWHYAGTPDAAWRMPDGRIWIVDVKSGRYEPGHSVQVAGGYWPLLKAAAEEGSIPMSPAEVATAALMVIPLDANLPKPVAIQRNGQPELFRAALAVYQWKKSNSAKRSQNATETQAGPAALGR